MDIRCFRRGFIDNEKKALKIILDIINNTTKDFKNIPSIDKTIANRYDQKLDDVQQWLAITEWSQKQISEATLDKVQDELFRLNIIHNKLSFNKIVEQI